MLGLGVLVGKRQSGCRNVLYTDVILGTSSYVSNLELNWFDGNHCPRSEQESMVSRTPFPEL